MAEGLGSPTEKTELFGNISRLSVSASVVERIEQLIIEARLSPGQLLPSERELAAQFAISRTVLREALSSLVQKGLVEVVQGRGTFVSEPSVDRVSESLTLLLRLRRVGLDELTDVRMLIEPEIAALAARRATDQEIHQLQGLAASLREHHNSPSDHVAADLAFHSALSRFARHAAYESIVEAVRLPVIQSMLVGADVPEAIQASDDSHDEVTNAVARRDPAAARAAMQEHMQFVSGYIAELSAHRPVSGR